MRRSSHDMILGFSGHLLFAHQLSKKVLVRIDPVMTKPHDTLPTNLKNRAVHPPYTGENSASPKHALITDKPSIDMALVFPDGTEGKNLGRLVYDYRYKVVLYVNLASIK